MLAELLTLFATTFAAPFVVAAESPAVALPQDINYIQKISRNVSQNKFSTDPRQPQVAAETDGAGLQIFITNSTPCLSPNGRLSYRVIVRNAGPAAAPSTSVNLTFPPILTLTNAAPETTSSGAGTATWQMGDIGVGHTARQEFSVSFRYSGEIATARLDGTARGGSYQALTTHTINGACEKVPAGPVRPVDEAEKKPAILCHPSERNCITTIPELLAKLGVNFGRAVNHEARQPILCSRHDPKACTTNTPQLGPRFAQAAADILPGECSVVEDAVVATPAFHDGYLRRTESPAFFIPKLWESSRDGSRLVHRNEIAGRQNIVQVRSTLHEAHTQNWDEYQRLVVQISKGATPESFATLASGWKHRIRQAQLKLNDVYSDLQKQRRANWSDQLCGQDEAVFSANPADCRAAQNAQTDIGNACLAPEDGGLKARLPDIFRLYRDRLDTRQAAYSIMQGTAARAYDQAIDQLGRDLTKVHQSQQAVFGVLYQPYQNFNEADTSADNDYRLNQWEIILDPAKQAATRCGADLTLTAPVNTSWCESGNYPEFVVPEAINALGDAKLPQLVEDGDKAIINELGISGKSCTGLPGDPYWASDCSCNCDQLVPGSRNGNPNILLCRGQAGDKQITRHDINITTPTECFNDARHQDPFF